MRSIALTFAGAASLAAVLAGALATGGCTTTTLTDNCTPTPCGDGATLDVCTKTDDKGVCHQAGYIVGSQTYYCNACDDCSAAATQANQACAALSGSSSGGASSSGGGSSSGGTGSSSGSSSGGTSSSGGGDAGAGATCSSKVACGAGSVTYEECTTLGPGGSCASIAYKTSDGHTFACAGCSSCEGAASQLSEYCANPGGTPTTSCSTATACGSEGVTYSECTTTSASGSCTSTSYEATDGTTFACAACGNCTSAFDAMESHCESLTTPTTSCDSTYSCGTGGVTYQECTSNTGGTCETAWYQTSDGQEYSCNTCSDCTTAYDDVVSYCDTLGSTGQQCGTTTCGSAATCCSCSGTPVCYTLIDGETCSSIGCQ